MKTTGEVREQAPRVVLNLTCLNPVPYVRFQVGVKVDNVSGNDALTEHGWTTFGACRCHGEISLLPPTFVSPCSLLETALNIVHGPAREEIIRRSTFYIRCQQRGWPLPRPSVIT